MTEDNSTPGGYTLLEQPVTQSFLEEAAREEALYSKACSDTINAVAALSAHHHLQMIETAYHVGIGFTDPEWNKSDLVRLHLENLTNTQWVKAEQKMRDDYFSCDGEKVKKRPFFDIEYELTSDLLCQVEQFFDYSEVVVNIAERSDGGHVNGMCQVGMVYGDHTAIVTLLAWPGTKNNEMKYRCSVDVFEKERLTYSWEIPPHRFYDEVSQKDFNSKAGLIGFTENLLFSAKSAYSAILQQGKESVFEAFSGVFGLNGESRFAQTWNRSFASKRIQEAIKYFYIYPYFDENVMTSVAMDFLVRTNLEIDRLGLGQRANAAYGALPYKLSEDVRLMLVENRLECNSVVKVSETRSPRMFLRTDYFSALDMQNPLESVIRRTNTSAGHALNATELEGLTQEILSATFAESVALATEISTNS